MLICLFESRNLLYICYNAFAWRGVRVVEGAALEKQYAGNRIEVRNADGISQGSQHLQTCLQSSCDGAAEGGSNTEGLNQYN